MTTPPPLPPPLPPKSTPVITWVYLGVIFLTSLFNIFMVYRTAVGKPNATEPFIMGMILGGAVFPLALVGGIASCWPKNRNFQSMVQILFWASLIVAASKLHLLMPAHKF